MSQLISFKAYVRWRPLLGSESSAVEIDRTIEQQQPLQSISLSLGLYASRPRAWKSGPIFTKVFDTHDTNSTVYESLVSPTLPQVLEGATCNFFAYGHSGSGKTHTVLGYDFEHDDQYGLFLLAARDLFLALDHMNTRMKSRQDKHKQELGVAVRLFEVRGKKAFDLFNNGIECHIREGPDGQTHIRGPTEILDNGKVRVRPIVTQRCRSLVELRDNVKAGLAMRKTGTSTIHDESSRTHAVLELEIINATLLDARNALIERESELVPVGKHATDVYLEENKNAYIRTPEGKFVRNPDYILDQARIDAAESKKKEYEDRVQAAETAVVNCLRNSQHSCLGGKFVFVDLAGSEYFDQGRTPVVRPQQTPQERQQGRQINTDLFALKEVIRARSSNQSRIPFRSSPLTMVLRNYFLGPAKGHSAIILTVSPSETQSAATVNTLMYGSLIATAGQVESE